jgi:hypothetical protein
MRSPRPLKIERTTMMAAVNNATAITDTIEITLIKFFFRLETR